MPPNSQLLRTDCAVQRNATLDASPTQRDARFAEAVLRQKHTVRCLPTFASVAALSSTLEWMGGVKLGDANSDDASSGGA
ncbi:MAG: hypothetical protein ACM3ZE_00220, partial [Myxococcales bacterium]